MTSFRKELNNKLTLERASTWVICSHLYRRLEVPILYTLLFATYTLVGLHLIGVF